MCPLASFDRFVSRARAIALALMPAVALAQPTAPNAGTMQGMQMQSPDPLGVSMDRMGSGTTWVPDAAPIPSRYTALGDWDLTFHGFAFGQYDAQGGARGGRQLGSLTWAMLMASHALAGGRFQARTMLSLDAAGVGTRGYPLLLQSGEQVDGEPLHDRQHPHDALMELGVLYERPVSHALGISLYAAPSGEPALGPVAFMHRPSAMDNLTAPIGHHWQDATHISFGVLTAGLFGRTWKLEGSAFNGREPDQYRWNVDALHLGSSSARLTMQPTPQWSFTAGAGVIHGPDADAPNETMHRLTASALYGTPLPHDGQLAAAVIWGANTSTRHTGRAHAVLAEAEAVLDARNTVLGRAELVQKRAEDLSLGGALALDDDRRFDVAALTLGYVRELARARGATLGLGALGTLNVVPPALHDSYGTRTPLGALLFLRLRPTRSHRVGADGMAGMAS